MGKLFRSWFKKKKKQGSIHSQYSSTHQPKADIINYATPQQQSINPNTRSKDDDALAFTREAASSSLLDDVLGGWRGQANDKDEDIRTIEGMYAPDLPPSSTSHGHRHSLSKSGTHFDNLHQIQQQQQPHQQQQQHHHNRHSKNRTATGSSENNRSSIYQQNRTQTQQPPPCRTAPETPGHSPRPPPPPSSSSSSSQDSMIIATPSSATTPSLAPFTKSSSPPPLLESSSSPALLDQNNSAHNNNPSNPNHGGTTNVGAQSDALTTGSMANFDQQQQRPRTMVQQTHSHPQLLQQNDQQTPIKPSHEEKRSRYLQATGVSMTRMKERHRQECRRSMQPTSQQMTVSSPQQQQQQQQADQPQQQTKPLTLSPSPSTPHLSFQRNIPVQNKAPPQRPFLPSPSMPALNPFAPASNFASTSFSQLMPTAPANSVVRSSSMMTDLHHHPRSTPTPTGWKGSTTSLSTKAEEQQSSQQHQQQLWRQHALFPYQSDIVLPPYNPAQLNTIHNQAPIMMMPHSTSYRMLNNSGNNSSGTHSQAFPRSVSVYGGQSDRMMMNSYGSHGNGYGSPGYLLRSTMMADSNVGLGTINSIQQQQQYQRKSMSAFPRSYKPQLSNSNSIQPQPQQPQPQQPQPQQQQPQQQQPQQQQPQQQQQEQKKAKRHCENKDVLEDQYAPNDTTMELPASFLPSSYSPSSNTHESEKVDHEATAVIESSSSESPSPQRQPSLSSSSKTPTGSTTGDKSSMISQSTPTEHHSTTPTKTGNSGLDEKLEIPSLVEHLPTKWQQQAELRIMAKKKTRRRRRFSLPTLPTITPSSSSSDIDGDLDQQKESAVDTMTGDSSKRTSPSTPPWAVHDKSSCPTTIHASCNSAHHHPSPPPVPACSLSNSRIPALPSHNPCSCHSCPSSSPPPPPPLALCCPSHTCEPSSSIPVPLSSSCCPPSTPCCSHHHHHHHRHHRSQQKQHRCHHHRSSQGMKKSTSMVPPSKLRQKGQKRQDAARDDEDNETIAEPPVSKKPISSYSLQRPSLRSFLPPRFSTSIPRLQQQQKPTASSRSWIPSRS